tara:strand:+ start:1133 stop:1279 length:147 start_codon:yes stop_codon:yes gene_type:complete
MENNIKKVTKLDPSKLLGFISTAKVGGKGTESQPLQAKIGSKLGLKNP